MSPRGFFFCQTSLGIIMHTIYFRAVSGNTVRIECPTLEEAQHYWDKLTTIFHMVSTRP
jgi:hypothetical protein